MPLRTLRWYEAAQAAVFIVAVVVAVALYLSGCGGASAETRTAYAVEQSRCLANERAIVDRGGTTYEEDREDLELERTRCDAALQAIYGGE